MNCEHCENKAISSKPHLCAAHFDSYVLATVQRTINEHELFSQETTICVAVSGGKDSLALLDILTRLGYKVEGLYIDEGISNYREITEKDLHAFVKKNNIKLRTVSFKEYAGFRLDDAMGTKKVHACTVCGTLRRYLLNKYAKEYEVIATGHNMDDEAQTVLINLARGNTSMLFRSGPKTQDNELFVQRVKPLYFLSEKHILTYTLLRGIKSEYVECPYAPQAYRAALRDQLNVIESMTSNTKRHTLQTYLQLKTLLHEEPRTLTEFKDMQRCSRCGEASTDDVCKTCKFTAQVQELIASSGK